MTQARLAVYGIKKNNARLAWGWRMETSLGRQQAPGGRHVRGQHMSLLKGAGEVEGLAERSCVKKD